MKITTDSLRKLNACNGQVELFGKLYPEGLELPKRNPARQDVLDAAERGGLNVGWWLRRRHLNGIVRRWKNESLIYEYHYRRGRLQDTADGTAAERRWNGAGVLIKETHYQDGKLQDTADGIASVRRWNGAKALIKEAHYQDNYLQDAADGTAAERKWTDAGTLFYERHY